MMLCREIWVQDAGRNMAQADITITSNTQPEGRTRRTKREYDLCPTSAGMNRGTTVRCMLMHETEKLGLEVLG
jgi:hypothetical protein